MIDRRSLFLREMGIQEWTLNAPRPEGQRLENPSQAAMHDTGATQHDWAGLKQQVSACQACGLCQTRKQTVFGVGAQPAKWLVVGEAPGADEDARGEPFVGQAGQLLDNMLSSIGLKRGVQVFITNLLKCRPPGNRDPQSEEIQQCWPFLQTQMQWLQPQIVLALGRFAAQTLLNTDRTIGELRGRVHWIDFDGRQVALVATYHPAYLLRNPAEKAKVWNDLCGAKQALNEMHHS
jgi:DNA polymerase